MLRPSVRKKTKSVSAKSFQNRLADEWHEGGKVEFGPRKYHIEYDAKRKDFNVSIFTKSKDYF